jgi:alpha-L-rhamnosidase
MKNKIMRFFFYIKRLNFILILCLFAGCIPSLAQRFSAIQFSSLLCEYRKNPLGINDIHPSLSWTLTSEKRNQRQTAYQILVASSLAYLHSDKGDIWNSDKIMSDQSIHVLYAGKSLQAEKRYYWKVCVWDNNNLVSKWSEVNEWTMGLLSKQDWNNASWISIQARGQNINTPPLFKDTIGNEVSVAPVFRKHFSNTKKVSKAIVSICGLGYYELIINKKKVSNDVLNPAFTNYNKRLFYGMYDVTNFFISGNNCIQVLLGNGFYNSPTADLFGFEKAPWKGSPKLILHLELQFSDGSKKLIISDSSWRWKKSAVIFNSIRGGETHDGRLPTDYCISAKDTNWKNVLTTDDPNTSLLAQQIPSIRVNEIIKPLSLTQPKAGIYVFDFGKNLTGWVRCNIHEKKGQRIVFDYNEILNNDGTVNTNYSAGHTYGRFQKDILIPGGKGKEIFEPKFTYHGFRYVQIRGASYKPAPDDITARSVHTDLDTIGNFISSDERLNKLQQAVCNTLLDCIHGIPGEEPTREKMGWTQDGQNTMESYLFNFYAVTAYLKYLDDMKDAQEINGHIPPIVPTNGWGNNNSDGSSIYYDDPWWGGTLTYVANQLYRYYGDIRILEDSYSNMKRYVDDVTSTAKDFIVSWSLGDWLDYGHDSAGPKLTPVEQTSTAAYFYLVSNLAKNAKVLGKEEDALKYEMLRDSIKIKFNEKFLNTQTGIYKEGSQTAQALPLFLNLVPGEQIKLVESQLLKSIKERNEHLSTGFVGVMPLMKYLAYSNNAEIAYKVLMQKQSPGWLHMIANDNSTLGENLNSTGYGTNHHPFGACIGSWLYQFLAGIQQDSTSIGFKNIIIKPEIVKGLEWVKASYNSPYGTIKSKWKKISGKIEIDLEIPVNTSALIYVPGTNRQTISENRRPINMVKDIQFITCEKGRTVFKVGSGKYHFISTFSY